MDGLDVTTGTLSLQSAAYATFYTQRTEANATSTGTPANPTQNIKSAIAGHVYHCSLDNYRYGNFSGQSFRVTITDLVTSTTIVTQTFATTQWVLQTVGFNFIASHSQIRVTIQDISGSDTNSGWIDNGSVPLVPEAATWGALGGLLSLGLIWHQWRTSRAGAGRTAPAD